MTEKILINKIKKATCFISDIADYYESNHLKIQNEDRKEISNEFANLSEMFDCLDDVVSTHYKSDTDIN